MGLKQISPPAGEPVTLAQAKIHCTEDGAGFDSAFSDIWIPSARLQAEHRLGRVLLEQTWQLTVDCFPLDGINLPLPPLKQVDFIKYLDPNDGQLITLASTEYQVVTDELVGRVLPAYGKHWPSARKQPGSVQIQFVAGYANAAAVPQNIKNWMLLAIATWYKNRESVVTGTIVAELPRDYCAGLLDKYVVERFA